MQLSDWIEKVGDDVAAEKLGCSERTAKSYRYKERNPKSARVMNIKEITGGKVKFHECFVDLGK